MINIILPNNVFTRVIASCLPDDIRCKVSFQPSAQITQNILNRESSVGLVPTMDLINHRDLFVSSKFGLSFDQSLCNSYLYYAADQRDVNSLALYGDVSIQEVILSKILFKEIYSSDIEVEIITNISNVANKNLLLTGDENFINERFAKGVSFSEEIVDTLYLPFVNYILASTDEEAIKKTAAHFEGIDLKVYEKVEQGNFDSRMSGKTEEYIKANISSLVIKFDEKDLEGIKSLLHLPYYHGIIKDIIEMKFV